MDARTVSIWMVHGRLKGVAFTGEPGQLKALTQHRRGEPDLVRRGGKWFLVATCEVPEKPVNAGPADWTGIARGIANLPTTSAGTNHQRRGLERYRRRMAGAPG